MNDRTVTELRTYLKKVKRDLVPEFDIFIEKVETFAKLRQEAEDCFLHNNYRAKSRRHALPLDWLNIARILNPDTQTPEVSLVTEVVNLCLPEVEAIVQDLRKVLIRQREKVSLGLVQQVDSHCLRWLSKQPGRNKVEKAGARQRILAIVRRENYNTLENRVFKDLICRIQNPCSDYLKRNEPDFKECDIVKRVKRFFVLCGEALRNPMMDDISDLEELPHPNYVLRQEWRYSKVWKAYCRIIRHAGIAERLWLRRQELSDTLYKLRMTIPRHTNPRAKYHCPIWFNYVDGKNDLLDKPFYENLEGQTDTNAEAIKVTTDKDVVIDLTGRQPCRDLLIYGRHDNAKPYLQNYDKPSLEDLDGKCHYFLREILKAGERTELLGDRLDVQHELERLRDYFEQLHALVGGERWYILVPDDWKPEWQEAVIKSVPLPRNRVFLLWRSIASIIGCIDKLMKPREGDAIAVIDIQQGGIVGMSMLSLALEESGQRLVPQRKSYVRHRECYSQVKLESIGKIAHEDSFLRGLAPVYYLSNYDLNKIAAFAKKSKHVILVDSFNLAPKNLPAGWTTTHMEMLERGTRSFIALRDKHKIAYYDELEALSLIVQTNEERIEPRELVKANEKSPGGQEVSPPPVSQAAILKRHSAHVDLVLCMGEATPDAPLKIKRHEFNRSLEEDHTIDLVSHVTPGQGMAVVTVMSFFLREPIELDFLRNMTDKGKSGRTLTMSTLEDEMERSFPPDSPDVISDSRLWAVIRSEVEDYVAGASSPNGKWFARAQKLYAPGSDLPMGACPLERLRRRNVFGNDPLHRYPRTPLYSFDFQDLFRKMADDYDREELRDEVIRLIAWTYASDVSVFTRIRQKTVRRLLDYSKGSSTEAPLFQEMTLCANLCTAPEEWSDCMNAIWHRISDYNHNVSHDFYLLYNLLQFHPTILRDARTQKSSLSIDESCWMLVQHIPYWYQKHQTGKVTIGYILKSLLYFLRCRRFDGKVFLTKEWDTEHYEIISECLKTPVHNSQEELRNLVVKYLDGKGTIDGLPVD